MTEFIDQPAAPAYCPSCQGIGPTFVTLFDAPTLGRREFQRCCARCSRILATGQFAESVGGRTSMTRTQVWLLPLFDVQEFRRAFEAWFPGGTATHIPLVPDAHPPGIPDGSPYLEVEVQSERLAELWSFLEGYADRHGCAVAKRPASGFGFEHSG